jgi:UDP-N-acetylglucosamine/UDP-N-acetylgalactosamine diphosphorylase
MDRVPEPLRQRLRQHGQEHALRWWDELNAPQRRELLDQLHALNFEELRQLFGRARESYPLPSPEAIKSVPVAPAQSPREQELRARGEEALRKGQVAALVVAGGQGTRLGFDRPKGLYPVGPVSRKSLFQVHAEKVLALRRRYRAALPFLVMTSPATHDETEEFFAEHRWFGLPENEVFFFCQGTMPALDLKTGRLLLEKKHRLFLSPDGHGGSLTALADSGLLDRLRQRGVRSLFYFQVDNPLVKIAEPLFLGHHLQQRSEVSSKVIAKRDPGEKLGLFVLVDGRCSMIEYSDLPAELARRTDESGRLHLWAGNPAIHVFDLEFLTRVVTGPNRIPFHVARKKVPYLDESGRTVEPQTENALKFERFIFDVLPLAERWVLLETERAEEFAPLKNREGADSPHTVHQAQVELAARWLEGAGIAVPRDPEGRPAVSIEVSPLFALDQEELHRKVDRALRIAGPTYLE